MKNLIKYITILVLTVTFTSCEEESNFQEPNIALVPVYSITDIQGADTPFRINIYRQKNLIIEYSSAVNAISFVSSNFMDTSSDTTFEVSVDKMVEGSSINYSVTADKVTGEGIMTVDGNTTYNIVIAEEQVYN